MLWVSTNQKWIKSSLHKEGFIISDVKGLKVARFGNVCFCAFTAAFKWHLAAMSSQTFPDHDDCCITCSNGGNSIKFFFFFFLMKETYFLGPYSLLHYFYYITSYWLSCNIYSVLYHLYYFIMALFRWTYIYWDSPFGSVVELSPQGRAHERLVF